MAEAPANLGQQGFALEARDLSVVRDNRTVFRSVRLTLAPGEIVALCGCNGAGKTTMLLCLAGILRPASGEVLWQGDCPTPAIRTRLGFVAHESSLYPALTAWENLRFAGRMWGMTAPEMHASRLLSRLGLADRAAQATCQLSRGLRQRLAIARAVIHDPAVLLLDEPFTSLDADGREWLTGFLCELRERDRAILFSTHQPLHESAFVDRFLSLDADGLRETHTRPGAAPDGEFQAWRRPQLAATAVGSARRA